jgi:hypothetical protein
VAVASATVASATSDTIVKAWSTTLREFTGLMLPVSDLPPSGMIEKARVSMSEGSVPLLMRDPSKYAGTGYQSPKLEVTLGEGTTLQMAGAGGDAKVAPEDFMTSLTRAFNGVMIAGAFQVPQNLRDISPGTVSDNIYGVMFTGDGRKFMLLFTPSEAWRGLSTFNKWGRSLRGAQLSICNEKVQEHAQELMSQTSLFYATAFVLSLNRFDPSSMGRPSGALLTSNAEKNIGRGGGGGGSPKKPKGDPKLSDWGALLARRNAAACPFFQRSKCTRAGCQKTHQCEWCGAKAHGGIDCPTPDAKRYRTG